MQGRRALAAMLATVALTGCGEQAQREPARIEIEPAPVATATPATSPERTARSRARRVGRSVSGTFRTAPSVQAPATSPAAPAPPRTQAPRRRKRSDYARFRAGQLEVLRAHCATRPEDDPRCRGTEVDERVAFAAFEASR